jgi:hypothetical protein
MVWIFCSLVVAAIVFSTVAWTLRRRLGRWAVPYVLQARKRRPPRDDEDVHLILCICDHYEPKNGGATPEQAQARIDRWVNDYPRQFGRFRDSDGRPPRHTFFYPLDEYEPAYLDALAGLCRRGFGEIEIHLHHHNDTAANLRESLLHFKSLFADRHGLLARHRATSECAYGFIHGNWALCNGLPGGECCGVNEELDILRDTGCYADFTMPSAPHPTQTRKLNSIYYARTCPGQPRSHETGQDVGAGLQPPNSLLLVQGPLVFDWSRCKWGVVPRLENGCLQGSQPPRFERLASWLRARVQVPQRPDWFFVKLHAHGGEEWSFDALLGEPMVRFHEQLADHGRQQQRFHYHYVTAREMYNLIKAAEAGWGGPVAEARDYELLWNGISASSSDTTPACASNPPGMKPPAHSQGPCVPA